MGRLDELRGAIVGEGGISLAELPVVVGQFQAGLEMIGIGVELAAQAGDRFDLPCRLRQVAWDMGL